MRILPSLPVLLISALWPAALLALNPFENGWQLDPPASSISYMSIKKGHVAEINSFATFNGQIDQTGAAEIKISLDSVDTKVDLRNVRMRFLFFETFLHPEAIITAQLDSAALSDLMPGQRKEVKLPLTLLLHGVKAQISAPVIVSVLSLDRINVATITPVPVLMKDFGLEAGRVKLEEAANVAITPLAIVSLDLVFNRSSPGTIVATPTAPQPVAEALPAATTALEPTGNFDRAACVGRFEILSRADSVKFASATARLDARSAALLDSLYDIVSRCPDLLIEIGGHTDSQGKAAWNMRLSQQRAEAVAAYLQRKGIPQPRMKVTGYGETQPLVGNETASNRARNRRIEFMVLN